MSQVNIMQNTQDKQTTLTKAQLHQKFKAIKLALKKSNVFYQNERKKVILSKIEHYKKTGNVRKLAIYESKLSG